MLFALSLAALATTVPQFGAVQPLTSTLPDFDATTAADFDGDGDMDIAAASSRGGVVAYFERLPGGEYAGLRTIDAGAPQPIGVAAADVTGDGNVDLFVVGQGSIEGVFLLVGHGDGTFEPPRFLGAAGRHGRRLKIEDLDGDGDLDVVIPTGALWGARTVVLQNLGSGVFAPFVPVHPDWAQDVQPFDADGDGDLDLMVAEQSGRLRVLQNDGLMQFTLLPFLANFTSVEQIEMADLDGDGDEDLVAALIAGGEIRVYENLGLAAFGPPVSIVSGLENAPEIALLDVDRDGDLDIVAAPHGLRTLRWFENLGSFAFGGPADLLAAGETSTSSLELADLNGDGSDDLLMATREPSVTILESVVQVGQPPYASELTEVTRRVVDVSDVVAIDIEGDGDLDLVSASPSDGLYLSRNRGFESFDRIEPLASGVTGARRLTAADLEPDGDIDIVLLDGTRRLIVLENDGTGAFTTQIVDAAMIGMSSAVSAIDIDADGDLDLVVLRGGEASAYDQGPGGLFGPRRVLTSVNDTMLELVVEDVDGDGTPDLAVISKRTTGQLFPPHRLRWFRGDGSGAFTNSGVLLDDIGGAVSLATIDLNNSAPIDFVWAEPAERIVNGATANAGGPYSEVPFPIDFTTRPQLVAVGDVDGDLRGDVIACTRRNTSLGLGTLEWSSSRWPGFFTPGGVVIDTLWGCSALRLADIDGDGDLDLVVASAGDHQVAWVPNELRGEIGVNYCGPAVLNGAGLAATMSAVGSPWIWRNDLTLRARQLPVGAPGLFLVSPAQGFTPMAGGSAGTLCLGGSTGRFLGPGQLQAASGDGFLSIAVDLTALPQPMGPVAPTTGSLWFFQLWYRDTQGGAPTSNFTDALSIVLQ